MSETRRRRVLGWLSKPLSLMMITSIVTVITGVLLMTVWQHPDDNRMVMIGFMVTVAGAAVGVFPLLGLGIHFALKKFFRDPG